MTDLDALIGKRIRAYRAQRNLSQTALADALDITFQQVQKYEAGVNHVSAGRLAQIAEYFGVPLLSFYENDSASLDQPRRGKTKPLDPQSRTLLTEFAKIKSPTARRQVLNLARVLAQREKV